MNQVERTSRIFRHASAIAALGNIRRGIEKESMRMTPSGELARTPHPRTLGNPLTHPHITTDFAEAQIEIITAVHQDIDSCFDALLELHAFVYQRLAERNELLWTSSMPCLIGGEEEIPIAEYGSTNEGRLKHLYRKSLTIRYGAKMQTVSGIHYNFSMPADLLSEAFGAPTPAYMHLIRNVNRYAWLLMLLFGASPALCHTFLQPGVKHKLKRWDSGTRYLPYATSLRMGPLGYTGRSQRKLYVSCNSLEDYSGALIKAMKAPYEPFSRLGLFTHGERQQMNLNLLQFEAEYYGNIRPKRAPKQGERAFEALMRGGIEYVELRCVDLNPYHAIGLSKEQVRFYDTFLLACLMMESPKDTCGEARENRRNQWRVVRSGRSPRLRLARDGESIDGKTWALDLLRRCERAAELLDQANESNDYSAAVAAQFEKIRDPERTPSARILAEFFRSKRSFFSYAKDLAFNTQAELLAHAIAPERAQQLAREVSDSLERAQRLESEPQSDFDDFVDAWLARV